MPIPVPCESCGKTLKVSEDLAGKRIKCPACGETMRVPPAEGEAAGGPSGYDVAASIPPVPPPPPSPPPPSPPVEPTAAAVPPPLRTTPREPWYYRALAIYAYVVAVLGLAQFVVALAIGILALVGGSNLDDVPPERRGAMRGVANFAAAAIVGPSLAGLVASLLIAAVILLMVDAARNVRALRHGAN